MGMFDYLHVAEEFLPKIKELDENNLKITNLQTKSLDCSLRDYYIDSNGDLYYDDVVYEIVENTNPIKVGWSPPFFQEETGRTRLRYPYTGEVLAVDVLSPSKDSEIHQIFVEVSYTFLEGSLFKKPEVKKVECFLKEKVVENQKKWELIHQKRAQDPIYFLTRQLHSVLCRVSSVLSKAKSALLNYDVKEFYEHQQNIKKESFNTTK
jgi:hypothetical protein